MKFALAGNPNSGKTTLFNNLTGSTAHVGNWPGVTVEKKEGKYKKLPEAVGIIDLPGIYSLSPYTPEEVVSRNFLIEGKPDLIINIVDATNLERNLYLTTQILEIGIPVVIAINMMDVINKEGTTIDTGALEKSLGVPIVPISALRNENIKTLMDVAYLRAKLPRDGTSVLDGSPIGKQYNKLLDLVKRHQVEHPVFHATKLLEGDELEIKHSAAFSGEVADIKQSYTVEGQETDYEAEIADIRYQYITQNLKDAIVKAQKEKGKLSRTEKIDKVLTHRIWGIPLFLLFMFAAFHLTFSSDFLFLNQLGAVGTIPSFLGELNGIPSPGVFLQMLVELFLEWIGGLLSGLMGVLGAAEGGWVHGLIIDGVYSGVSSVLTFLPQIVLLFVFLAFMEDTGYMARVAFIMDRALRRFGLSGRAFIPMLMGFGCSVPAMMGTRTLESEKEKKLTIMLMPFFSCGAKMPIWAAITAAVFPASADIMVFAVYLSGILIAILAALILKNTLLKGGASHFIMEMPSYRLPQIKSFMIHLWDKAKGFIIRATTIIAASTIVIWFLSSFTFRFEYVELGSDNTMLASIGKALHYIFIPLGFADGSEGWKAVVSIFTGLIAKEGVVSTMAVLYGGTEEALILGFTPLAAFSFMLFNLLCIPCMAAVATARSELKSRKWLWITIGFWMLTAYVVCLLVYQIGSLFSGSAGALEIIVAAAAVAFVAFIIVRSLRKKKKAAAAGNPCAGCDGCDTGRGCK